jgi:DNA helicase-2/ATP-dependent DNA helicase PcrA
MTVHAAKGLEFGVVFIAGMEEGVFPSLREGDLDHELEEERRLCYVALTRAKDRAILSWARMRRSYDETRRNPPSRFLDDLPSESVSMRGGRRRMASPSPQQMGQQMGQQWGSLAPRPGARDHLDDFEPPPQDEEKVYYLDEDGDDPIFPRGAFVRHKIFGVGEIEEGSGRGPDRKLQVRFPGVGLKMIVARFVNRVR